MALLSSKAEYIALTLVVKEAMWLRLLLTELSFLQPDLHHAFIRVLKHNTNVNLIQENLAFERERESKSTKNEKKTATIIILLKDDN